METILLDGRWSLSAIIADKNIPLTRTAYTLPIPGEIHDALYSEGAIEDPYKGLESLNTSFISKSGWKAEKTFSLSKNPEAQYDMLLSRPIGKAVVVINGMETGEYSDTARIRCTDALKDGKNTISIIFPPQTSDERITALGIKGGIWIESSEDYLIRSVSIESSFDGSEWIADAEITIDAFKETEVDASLSINEKSEAHAIKLRKGTESYHLQLRPGDVQLWYPNGCGQPHLYPAEVLIDGCRFMFDIGFRTIEADERLIVNGIPLFLKGASYAKEDFIPTRTDSGRIERLIRSAKSANMNVLRIDGWKPSPELYDAADRCGIMIYQTGLDSGIKELISHPSFIPRTKNTVSVLSRVKPIGFPSLPSMKTIERIGDKKKNITSPAMDYHGEEMEKILMHLASNFLFPENLEKMVYLSELQQAMILEREAAEIRMDSSASGILIDRLNDSWPAAGRAAIEYGGKWKLLLYAARAFFSPLAPILYVSNDKAYIYVVNDTGKKEKAELSIKLRSFSGSKKDAREYTVEVEPGSFTKAAEFPLKRLSRADGFLYVKMATKDILRERVILLDKPKNLNLENPEIKAEFSKADARTVYIKLKASKPALYVALDAGDIKGIFSDNLISVRPSAEKTIIFTAEDDINETEFRSKLKIMNLL